MTKRGHRPFKLAPLAALVMCSCQSPSYGDWLFQLDPESACYEVNLLDGLDEHTTEEIDALFDCFNHQKHFTALEHLAELSQTPASSSDSAQIGVELAKGLNQIPWMSFVTGVGSDTNNISIAEHSDEYLLELITGTSAATSKTPGFTVASALNNGAFIHMETLFPALMSSMSQQPIVRTHLSSALRHPEFPKIWATLSQFNESTSPSVVNLLDDVGPVFGDALTRTQNQQNNRWSVSNTGSLQGLLVPAIDSGWFSMHSATMATLLNDREVITALLNETVDLYTEGLFVPAGRELHGLVQVDKEGGTLQSGEASAFEVVARLVHKTDRPISCSVDVWLGELDISVSNAAVTLLETVADMDPEDAISTGNWVSSVIGVGISESLLRLIVSTNLCDGLTESLIDDLSTLEFLFSERNENLAESFIRVLHTFKTQSTGVSRIPEVVTLISSSYNNELTRPAEEVLRDILTDSLTAHLGHGLSILNDLEQYGLDQNTGGFTFEQSLDILAWLFSDSGTTSPFEDVLPIIEQCVEHDSFWDALFAWANLMSDPRSRWAKPLGFVPIISAPEDGTKIIDEFTAWIDCTDCVEPFLHIGSNQELGHRLFSPETAPEGTASPLEFMATLLIFETVEDLREILDSVLRTLENSTEE